MILFSLQSVVLTGSLTEHYSTFKYSHREKGAESQQAAELVADFFSCICPLPDGEDVIRVNASE